MLIGKLKFTDAYLHFKKDQDFSDFLTHYVMPDFCRFYAKDYIAYRQQEEQDNKTMFDAIYLTIQTATSFEFEVNDIVYSLKEKKKWRIKSVTIDDDNTMKQHSSRPKKITTLELMR